jgi:MbtH protein
MGYHHDDLVECCCKEGRAFPPHPDGLDPRGKDDPSPAAKIGGMITTELDRQRRPPGASSKEDDVTNPFEDENGLYHVLINEEGQHSLWPSFVAVPKGWTIIHQSDNRAACLEFINQHWTDMRPNSLIEIMKELSGSEKQEEDPSHHAVEPKGDTLTREAKAKH